MKLNKKNFEYFSFCVNKWINYYSLSDWQVEVMFKEDNSDNNMADCCADEESMTCVINLYKDWGDQECTEIALNMTAHHEVCELLLWELGEMVHTLYSYSATAKKKHQIINRIQSNIDFSKE